MKKGIYKSCIICKKETYIFLSLVRTGRGKYCSKRCFYLGISQDRRGIKPKNFMLFKEGLKKYESIHGKYRKPRTKGQDRDCLECYKKFYATPGQVKINQGKYCSRSCSSRANSDGSRLGIHSQKGAPTPLRAFKPRSHTFQGSIKEYKALHYRINKLLGKPRDCANPNRLEKHSRKVEWANKSGKYLENLTDWISLCKRCHWLYDKQYLRMFYPGEVSQPNMTG